MLCKSLPWKLARTHSCDSEDQGGLLCLWGEVMRRVLKTTSPVHSREPLPVLRNLFLLAWNKVLESYLWLSKRSHPVQWFCIFLAVLHSSLCIAFFTFFLHGSYYLLFLHPFLPTSQIHCGFFLMYFVTVLEIPQKAKGLIKTSKITSSYLHLNNKTIFHSVLKIHYETFVRTGTWINLAHLLHWWRW